MSVWVGGSTNNVFVNLRITFIYTQYVCALDCLFVTSDSVCKEWTKIKSKFMWIPSGLI